MDPKQPLKNEQSVSTVIRLDTLQQRKTHMVKRVLSSSEMSDMAKRLNLIGLEKARLTGELRPTGKRDWDFTGDVGGTVTQSCVVTLAPVRTRIDEPVIRRYRADMIQDDSLEEIEMPEDDSLEPLPEAVDILELLEESLALSLPFYPRVEGAETGESNFTKPGEAPMTDEDAKPFAGLAALRGKLDSDKN